jgi:hypothetical protein
MHHYSMYVCIYASKHTCVYSENFAQAAKYGGSVILELEGRSVVRRGDRAARSVYMCVCMYVYVCMYVCMCMSVRVCVCVCVSG